MRSRSPSGQPNVGSWRNSTETSAFDTKPLVESLGASNGVVNNTVFDSQSPDASAPPSKEMIAGPSSSNPNLAATEEQLDAAEQRLLDEVKKLATKLGPLDGAVKVKLLNTKHHILVHDCLLIGKSTFCRSALSGDAKKSGAYVLTLPSYSMTTLAYFLRWVYNDSILPEHGTTCRCCAEHNMAWPDLMSLWVFASEVGAPKLQNKVIDILVRKMASYLDCPGRSDEEIYQVRAAFNLLWPGKNLAQGEVVEGDADKPLRTLMLEWFANPMYQTKAKAEQLLAGGLSRSLFRDYALHAIEKNFSMGDDEVDDDVDSDLHIKAMQAVTGHALACLWKIKPERYHVNDKTFSAAVGKKH